MYYGDLCDPGTNGRAPRVHNILSLPKDFKDTIYVLATQQQVVASRPEGEGSECDKCDIEEDPHKSNLVLLRVQRMLLPLLLKEEILQKDFWASDVDSAAVGAALHSIVTELETAPGQFSFCYLGNLTSANISKQQRKPFHGANSEGLWSVSRQSTGS
jgi:hypothetical protein